MEAIIIANEKQEPKGKGISGLFFVGSLMLGLAIGFLIGNVAVGALGGLGVGFIALGIVRYITGE
jgi:hypothetical protein